MNWGRGTLLVLICAGLAGASFSADDLRSREKELRQLQQALAEKKSEKAAADRREKELSQEASRISTELRSSQKALQDVEKKLGATEEKRQAVEERLWASQLGINQWLELLTRQMRDYYELKTVMGSAAFQDITFHKAALVDKINGLAFAQDQHAQVESLRNELVNVEYELKGLRQSHEKEQKRFTGAQVDIEKLRKTAQGRRALLENDIRELQSSARELQNMVERLIREETERKARTAQARPAPAPKAPDIQRAALAALKRHGPFPWPAHGPVVESFGKTRHPELDTYIFSNGITLRTAPGVSVSSVEEGEVLFASEFMSYGLMVLVSHPGDIHTVYAHLGQINVTRGQKIAQGAAVGTAGTDDAGHGRVYFELRAGGSAVDPVRWLK